MRIQVNPVNNEPAEVVTDKVNQSRTDTKKDDSKAGQVNENGSINASCLNLAQDEILKKQIEARKNALKELMDTFSNDSRADNAIAELYKDNDKKETENSEYLSNIADIEARKEELTKNSSITEDSQEQKDLELRRKFRDAAKPGSDVKLTKEEFERINEMGPATEYQSAMLEYDDIQEYWQGLVDENRKTIIENNKSVRGIKEELLKVHPMVDADKRADAIMDAAAKEVMGMLIQEGIDHADELKKETEEKIEEKREEEEKAEKLKENQEKSESNKNRDTLQDEISDKIKYELERILKEDNLLAEDFKGIDVDELV